MQQFTTFKSWKPAAAGLALGGAFLGVGGCGSAPVRANAGDQYSQYVMSLYNQPAVARGPRTIEFPVNIAAAEVGETSAQSGVLEKLRQSHDLFGKVESLPAGSIDPAAGTAGRDPVQKLQSLARDQGADYLLIYGATVTTRTRLKSLSVIDLTIVGAFVPGTRDIDSTSRASASLIDVRTGSVVLSAGAESTAKGLGSAATSDSDADKVASQAHDDSLAKLADQVIAAAKRRASEEATLDDPQPAPRAASARTTEK
jgi:hypothetical protein